MDKVNKNKTLSAALAEVWRDDRCFYWRFQYLDRLFKRALAEEVDRIISERELKKHHEK